jgi:hypothetical protein
MGALLLDPKSLDYLIINIDARQAKHVTSILSMLVSPARRQYVTRSKGVKRRKEKGSKVTRGTKISNSFI